MIGQVEERGKEGEEGEVGKEGGREGGRQENPNIKQYRSETTK